MALLFADTTYDINLGLLDDEFGWVEFRKHTGQKASAVLQAEAHKLCLGHGLKPRELKGIVTVAGPGFYTGLRLSEGFADIFRVFGVPCYSFYSYEVPLWCGIKEGVWMTKAYRGEYFFHRWGNADAVNTLVPTKDLESHLSSLDHLYIHSIDAVDQQLKSYSATLDLLRNQPQQIFTEVVSKKLVRDSYYFRAPEDEFRVST